MIASWMAYASLVTIALAVAGLALEPVAAAWRWPLRWIWAGALAASVGWPAVTAVWRAIPTTREPVALLPFTIMVRPTQALAAAPGGLDRAAAVDRALAVIWGAFSALLMLRLSHAAISIRRHRRAWRRDSVDGTAVCVSIDVGPAVVGLRPMEVVLPEWILSLDASLRAMVLRHEGEHRAARDPYLLVGATIALALMPWNVALWFLGRRLRLAIEMDCDARVLRAHPWPERYGLLILTVAQRRSAAPMLLATRLSEPSTHLERRIIAMQETHRIARPSTYAATIGAVAVLALACSLRPEYSDPAFDAWMATQGFQTWSTARPAPGNPTPRYPDPLRQNKIEGSVLAQFVIDTSGLVDMQSFKVLQSTNDQFVASVRAALPAMRFISAAVNGRKVKQLIQMPFDFGFGDGGAALDKASSGGVDTPRATVPCQQSAPCPVLRLPSLRVRSASPPL